MEREFVRWIYSQKQAANGVVLGPADDAAIVQFSQGTDQVLTSDMLMDGVDFLCEEHEPELIGRKCIAVNLSDLAAMGATPRFGLISLALPHSFDLATTKRMFQGATSVADEFGMTLVGGDTNRWSQPLAVSVTALGEVPEGISLRRDGAQTGDRLFVTGPCGGSILGKHFSFTPRVAEGQWLRQHHGVHAAIDISDGLAWDTFQLAEASGLGAILESSWIPIHPDAEQLAERDQQSALEHALRDGEDFELILAVDENETSQLLAAWPFDEPLVEIGYLEGPTGLWLRDADGNKVAFDPKGYEH